MAQVRPGDVVAVVGDFEAKSILRLLKLLERKAIVVPLTPQTREDHKYFFESACVNWVTEAGQTTRIVPSRDHRLLEELRARGNPGLILFSTGTAGRPKAILHDMKSFLRRFEIPRPPLKVMAFLQFDHIGGINTLMHTLFNGGTVVAPGERSVPEILEICRMNRVEVLPTTPTFLRMMLLSNCLPEMAPDSLKVITYGTERMDQSTLSQLCDLLPLVDFRQTYGMSELGILRVKSKARNSLFMKVGGDGVRINLRKETLRIWSPNRMLGYLNADSPFYAHGWYDTQDVVEAEGDYVRIVARKSEVINVGGLKLLPSEVERVALGFPGVSFVSVFARDNPVTGQHVELVVESASNENFDVLQFREHLSRNLPSYMVPRRVTQGLVPIGHRFKQK